MNGNTRKYKRETVTKQIKRMFFASLLLAPSDSTSQRSAHDNEQFYRNKSINIRKKKARESESKSEPEHASMKFHAMPCYCC
jgi:hypothetical protein